MRVTEQITQELEGDIEYDTFVHLGLEICHVLYRVYVYG